MATNSLIVFGDSLSDQGKLVEEGGGVVLSNARLIDVNPSGRFSDCRVWTDYIYDWITGHTLIASTAAETRNKSKGHFRFRGRSSITATHTNKSFLYLNYSYGGAVGTEQSTIGGSFAGKFLKAFELQLAEFKEDLNNNREDAKYYLRENSRPPVFVIWFGANDLYTANCIDGNLAKISEHLCNTAVTNIKKLLGANANPIFIFPNVPSPMASNRYKYDMDRAPQNLRMDKSPSSHNVAVKEDYRSMKRNINNGYELWMDKKTPVATKDMYEVAKLSVNSKRHNHMMAQYVSATNNSYLADIAKLVSSKHTDELVQMLGIGRSAPVGADTRDLRNGARFFKWEDGHQEHREDGLRGTTTLDGGHPTDWVHQSIACVIGTAIKNACGNSDDSDESLGKILNIKPPMGTNKSWGDYILSGNALHSRWSKYA